MTEPASHPACAKCEQVHCAKRGGNPCKSHRTRDGIACAKTAMRGQDVCASHGGKARQNREAGRRRDAEDKAAKVMRRFGGPVDTAPTEALLDAVKWTAGYVAWLRDKIASLTTDEDLVWGQTKETEGDVVVGNGAGAMLDKAHGKTSEAKPNAWLELLGQWHDRLVRICAEAIKAGIEERRVKLAEQQGALVADVIRKILRDLNLTPEQAELAPEIASRHLRAVAG